jgi:hypothetical protein
MKSKNIEFVIVSQNNYFKIDKLTADIFSKKYSNIKFNFVENNSDSLANVYNSFIKKYRELKNIDYLIFMHADVELDIEKFISHIIEVEGKYDVIGLCGCSKISVGQSPLNWWTGSNLYPQHKWGYVNHGELGNKSSFFNSHSPDVTDHEVACIDGLCIILTKNAIEKSNILFDTTFTFSHYDTDFSFECIFKHNLKLGVIIRKDLKHWSVGKSILTQEFKDSEIKFRNKWKF